MLLLTFSVFYYYLAVLILNQGLYLLGRHSTTCTTPQSFLVFALVISKVGPHGCARASLWSPSPFLFVPIAA
jgi:uncharacterized membrane protein YfbV (UPF0208 family)